MLKNLLVFNLPNERDDLILETNANNKHWSVLLKNKEKDQKLYKYYSEIFNKVKYNYPMMEKENLAVIRKIKNFLIF